MKFFIFFLFMVADILTGFIKAYKLKNVQSSKLRDGLLHKSVEIMVILLSYAIDYIQKDINIGIDIPLFTATFVYLIITELASIFENINKIDENILPDFVKKLFIRE